MIFDLRNNDSSREMKFVRHTVAHAASSLHLILVYNLSLFSVVSPYSIYLPDDGIMDTYYLVCGVWGLFLPLALTCMLPGMPDANLLCGWCLQRVSLAQRIHF